MDNSEQRLAYTRVMFNSIGICGDGQSLARLVGFHEDALDYYYRLRFIAKREREANETCWSAVGWFIPLRDVLPEDAYKFLEHIFCLNGCPPAESFLVTKSSRDEDVAMYGERTIAAMDAQ